MHIQLEREGYGTLSAARAEQALDLVEKDPPQLVITDLNLPGMSGMELLKRVRVEYPGTAVVVMTAFGTIPSAVEAIKAGAYDYITKPVHPYELKALAGRVLDHCRLAEEVQVLRTCLDRKYGFDQIIGGSETLLEALDVAAAVAATDATVLIQGETGTGKELVAKAMHFRSPRREHPFVTINCGSIPRDLLESELFGHVKGSFTGAMADKKGKIEAAQGGTVLLDEIGEMPPELQVRILRLIQEKEIEKVGATAPLKVDVRIISATHRDLMAMVRAGTFREDLYYRLLVVPIALPPLRERQSDIPGLVHHFFAKCKAKHHRNDLTLAGGVIPYFCNYAWPGNIRELENTMERIVLLCRGNEVAIRDLPDFLRGGRNSVETLPASLPENGMNLSDLERQVILQSLQKFQGNQTRTARYLGMSRRTLAYRLEKYGILHAPVKILKQSV